MTKNKEQVPVIQTDRDARSEILLLIMQGMEAGGSDMVERIDEQIVQLLARHRIDSTAPLVEALEQISHYQVGGHESYAESFELLRHIARATLASIRGDQ
jgi:tryptophanase